VNNCLNCANINCKVDGKSNHMVCAEHIKCKESEFDISELKDVLNLLRLVNSIGGDVNRCEKLRSKVIRMIGGE